MATLQFPFGGVSKALAYQSQAPFTTVSAKNVRPADVSENRKRGGSRPGFVRDVDYPLPVGAWGPTLFLSGTTFNNFGAFNMVEDNFPGPSLSSAWVSLGFAGVSLPTITNGIVGTSNGIVGAARPLPSISASNKSVHVHANIVFDQSSTGAVYGLYSNMAATPDGDGEALVAELTLTRTSETALSAVVDTYKVVTGTWTKLATSGAFTVGAPLASPVFRLSYSSGAGTVHAVFGTDDANLTAGVPAAVGNSVGFYVSTDDGHLCGMDTFSASYFVDTGDRPTRHVLIDYAQTSVGRFGYEYIPGIMYSQANTGYAPLAIRSWPVLQTARYDNRLYVADFDYANLLSGTDGVLTGYGGAARLLDSDTAGDWTTHGISTTAHMVLITGDEGTELLPITAIHATNGLTLGTGGTGCTLEDDTGMTWAVVRAPKYVRDVGSNVLDTYVYTSGWKLTGWRGVCPIGCPLCCLYNGRLVYAGGYNGPNVWYMSRVGDPEDFFYGDPVDDEGRAVASTSSDQLGVVGDPITALVPYRNQRLIIAQSNKMHVVIGDPAAGGSMDLLSPSAGIISANAWCIADTGELYHMTQAGVNVMPEGPFGPSIPLSKQPLPDELQRIDPEQNFITLAWDRIDQGMWVFVTPRPGSTNPAGVHYWWDKATGGWFPIEFGSTAVQPTCAYDSPSEYVTMSGLIFGCLDGVPRRFNRRYSADCGLAHASSAITSNVWYGPLRLAQEGHDGFLDELTATVASGSGEVDWSLYVAHSPEAALGSTAVSSGTWTYSTGNRGGRQYMSRPGRRGHTAYLKLSNGDTRSWAVEEVRVTRSDGGVSRL